MAHTKVTKTYSQNTGAANTFSYSGSFDVFKGTEVQVELDNVQLTFTASTINDSALSPREYSVDTSAKTVHIGGADLSSGTIVIRPVTDMGAPTPRATYAPGSSITSEDLNNNQLQLMRKAMEYDEQKLSSLGGTMTGHLTMGEDQTIIFEGATDDGYETTLTVADPTGSDKTITLPNVTGTVVTTGDTGSVATGMIAADAITGAKIADDALNSEHYTDGSIDAAHLASSSVTTAKINSDAVTGAKIADDAIDSEHYTDGSIDTAHIADSQITSAKIADGTIVAGDLASDSVTTAKITDGNVTTAKIAADAITAAKIADDVVNSEHFAAGSIDTEHIADLQVTTAKIAADAITGAKLADDAVNSEHYTDASIDTAHIADGQVTAVKVASNAVTTAKITDSNVTTAKIADDAITIAKVGCEQTTISDSDSHIPTSGAVVDYVAAQIAPIGGLEVIADEDNFPSTQPASGVVISIADAAGIVVSGSGSSTTARTAGNGSDNVTINNFPSSLYSETLASGNGLMVTSTGSSNVYNYHKLLASESDVKQLSDDINDFNSRYRINSGEPGSNNDEGDLVYDTAANKMKVYDGSSWGEVTSTGDFKYLVMTNAGTTNAATLNGSNVTFDLKETSTSGSAASVTSAAQLMVSVNGVIQKANTGTSASGLDGFVMADADTITFCAAPASGDDIFIVQFGSALSPVTPADGTVVAAKIGSGAVTTAKIADANVTTAKLASDAVTGAKIADDAVDSEHYTDGSIDTAHLAADAVTGAKIADDAVGAEHIEVLDSHLQLADNCNVKIGTGNDLELYHNGTYSFIKNATGSLTLQSPGLIQLLNADASEYYIEAVENGAVSLYYDNGKVFETTSSGAKVNGILECTSHVKLGDNDVYIAGAGDDLQISHNGSNSIIKNTTGTLQITADNSEFVNAANSEYKARYINNGAVELYHDGSLRSYTSANGFQVKKASSDDVEFRLVNTQNTTAGATNTILSEHDARTTAKIVFGRNNDANDFSASAGSTQGDIQFHTTASGTLTEHGRFINTGYFHVCNDGNFVDCSDSHAARSTNASWAFRAVNSHASTPYGVHAYFNNSDPDTGNYPFFLGQDQTTTRFRVQSNGNVENHDNSYGSISDIKLKENIVDAGSQWEDIKAIKVRNFNFKASKSKKKLLGVVAQELETTSPGLVVETPDEDLDHNDLGTTTKSVRYSILYMKAIKALQEAMAKIETLETKVAALEAK
jgi:hypothetical protein